MPTQKSTKTWPTSSTSSAEPRPNAKKMTTFDSKAPLARLRPGVECFPWRSGPFEQALAYDHSAYAPQRSILLSGAFHRFDLLDGRRSAADLQALGHGSIAEVRAAVEQLDANFMLDNAAARRRRAEVEAEFNAAALRPAFHAGTAYPASAAELTNWLTDLLDDSSAAPVKPATAIIAPHIDLRIGAASYAPAYQSLRAADPDLVLVAGTAHYHMDDYFMPSFKDFETPLGRLETARDLWDELAARLPFDLCREERAHRVEHSIEFHLPFIQHVFRRRPPRILPLLIGSSHEWVARRGVPADSARFNEFIDGLRAVLAESGLRVAYVASVDFAHFGRKFGDDFDAHTRFTDVRTADAALTDAIGAADERRFFQLVADVDDKWRICGLSPIYSLMRLMRPAAAELLDYQVWDERERGSAVSYAALRLE